MVAETFPWYFTCPLANPKGDRIMSRMFVRFGFLLVAIVVLRTSLRAEEPVTQGGVLAEEAYGTVTLMGSRTYSGGTAVNGGTLQVGDLDLSPKATTGMTLYFDSSPGLCPNITSSNTWSNGTIISVGSLQLGTAAWNPAATNCGTLNLDSISLPSGCLSADFRSSSPEPTNGATLYFTTVLPQGNSTYLGSTTVKAGVLQGNWGVEMGAGGTVTIASACAPGVASISANSASTPPTLIPAGPVFYIITEGAGLGDSVRRLPVTGNETVLDAISQINGLSQVSSKKMWIARPAPHNFGCQQILPVEWDAIAQGAQTATNYQLLPGDRLYVAEDELLTFTNVMAKVTAPIERLAGIASLGNSTIRGFQTMGRNYNRTRNGL